MIEKLDGQMELCCDECPRVLPRIYLDDEFDVMIQDTKDAGWRISKENNEWVHRCPSCRRKM